MEKEELIEALSSIHQDYLDELQALFSKHPWFIPYLYVNLAAKKFALSSGDLDAFRDVIETEAKVAEDL